MLSLVNTALVNLFVWLNGPRVSATLTSLLLESEVGSAKVAIYHAVVVENGFAIIGILKVDLSLAAFMLFVSLDCTLLTKELDTVFKGDTRDTLKTLDNFQLVELVAQAIDFFDEVLFS